MSENLKRSAVSGQPTAGGLARCFNCGHEQRAWHLVFNPATGLYQPARERMDNGRLVIELEGVGKRTWQEADLHMAELFVEQLARDVQAAREAREAKK